MTLCSSGFCNVSPSATRAWRNEMAKQRKRSPYLSDWERAERDARIRGLKREGSTARAIAEATGCSERHVVRVYRKAGLGDAARPCAMSLERRTEIEALGIARLPVKLIARAVRADYATVCRVLDEAHIPRRKLGELWPGDTRSREALTEKETERE